jgi:hypothetical protein
MRVALSDLEAFRGSRVALTQAASEHPVFERKASSARAKCRADSKQYSRARSAMLVLQVGQRRVQTGSGQSCMDEHRLSGSGARRVPLAGRAEAS